MKIWQTAETTNELCTYGGKQETDWQVRAAVAVLRKLPVHRGERRGSSQFTGQSAFQPSSQGVSSDRRNETVNTGNGGWESTLRAVGGSSSGIWSRRLLTSLWGGDRDPGTDKTRCRNIFLEQMPGNASVSPWRSWWGWTGRGQVTRVDGGLNVFSDLQRKKTFRAVFQRFSFSFC